MSFFGWRHWDVLDLDLHLLLELLQLLVIKQELIHFSLRSLELLLSLGELGGSVLQRLLLVNEPTLCFSFRCLQFLVSFLELPVTILFYRLLLSNQNPLRFGLRLELSFS